MADEPKTDLTYLEALHAIQTGIAYSLGRGGHEGDPKHLRTGIDSALVNDAALARLLVKKGVFTLDEYTEEIRLEACREVDRREAAIFEMTGAVVKLR